MGRRSRACHICRARKSRCLPGTNGLGCKRCEESGAECTPHQATKRTSLLRETKGRFATNSHGVSTSTGEGKTPSVLFNGVQPLSGAPSPRKQADIAAPTQQRAGALGQVLLLKLAMGEDDRWPAFKSLDMPQANVFLGQYHCMSQAVPFAIQLEPGFAPGSPQATTLATDGVVQRLAGASGELGGQAQGAETGILDCLLHASPLLLLAAILTGSSSDAELEKQAENLFRHVLADRVIVKGQKTLELLQGLLVYLTWYHHRFDPETLQFYQFLQLANGMVFDLGLPKKFSKLGELTSQTTRDLNEFRAFLLCYFLNCGGAVLGYDRPENMRCIESLRTAARVLASMSPGLQDKDAVPWVELLHVVAHHQSANLLVGCGPLPVTSGPGSMRDWERIHLRAGSSPQLVSSFHFITAYSLLKSSRVISPSSEDVRVCVRHFHELLSNILSQELAYLVRMGIVEWAHLITTLFLLARLGKFEALGGITADSVLQSPVHEYVARFRALMQDLRARVARDVGVGAPHLLGWLERILVAVAERAASWEGTQMRSSSEIGHQGSAYELVNSFLIDGRSASAHARHATPTMKEGGIHTPMEDFWSDFMSDWLQW